MERFFNTAGPIKENRHYFIPPLSRLDLEDTLSLIHQEKYFLLHAPRQTGKTTLLRSLMTYLNDEGTYTCLHINVEKAQPAREKVKEAMWAIVSTLAEGAQDSLDDSFIKEKWMDVFKESGEYGTQEVVLELKLRYGSREATIKKGLEQTYGYMDKCGTKEGYLLIFDRSSKLPWGKKIFKKQRTFKGTLIPVYGM